MFPKFLLVLCAYVLVNVILINSQAVETNMIEEKPRGVASLENELVKIQLYYESLCPGSRNFETTTFKSTVLELGSYLDIQLYPYGNARTIDNGHGNYTFICQHGPAECYGNKLHACAIDALQNNTLAVLYNACLMDFSHGDGSDDAAAEVCATSMNIEPNRIKYCAKGNKGSQLLKYYGDESKKAAFKFVPYALINGVFCIDDHFRDNVCKAFKNPPPQCKQ